MLMLDVRHSGLLRTFRATDADAFDLHPRQLSPMSDRAMITFTPFEFERDDFFVLPLLDHFGRDLRARDQRIAVRELVAIGIQSSTSPNVAVLPASTSKKIDIDRVALRDAILSSAGFDNCVSHKRRFLGEKAAQNSTDRRL